MDLAEWQQHQEQDADLQPALRWLEAQRRPPWEEVAVFSKATKGLWSQFGSLRLSQGVLQRAWKEPATGEEKWQMVVPKDLRDAVLEAMHGAAGSGHFGVSKTLRRLRKGFYWGQCRRDVEDFCRRCDPCMARKGPPGRSHAPLQQFPVGAPMERVAVDVVGPLPCSDGGNRYVLTAIDYFTKWPEAYAIPDQEAETVVEALVGGMFSRKQQLSAGVRQKRNYDVREKGRHFQAGELVWVYNPVRKKGRCPKLDSQWVGPCRVLERVGEVVYRLQLPPKGRRVVLHRDRLAPYRGVASPMASVARGTPPQPPLPAHSLASSPGLKAPSDPTGPVDTAPQAAQPRRQRRPPGRFRDFVVS